MSLRWAQTIQRAAHDALFLLYPPQCPLCETRLHSLQSSLVCPKCLEELERQESPWCVRCGESFLPTDAQALGREQTKDLCDRCGTQRVPFERARAYGPYEGRLARLIQLYKYGGERALARVLASLLYELLQAERLTQEIDGITFVPMSRKRQRERGFNQAELLARRLGQLTRKPVFSALHKVQETKPQEALSRAERLQNLKGAFASHGQARYESVLLVDDVYTTGATAWECAQALKEAGYKRVYVLTVARTPAPSLQAQDQQRTEADDADAR